MNEIVESLFGLDEITRPIHHQRIVEARVTFWSAIALFAIGTFIVLAGAWGPEFHATKAALGLLLNVIGAAVLKLYHNVNERLDRFRRDRDAMHMILQISDPQERDREIRDFAKFLRDEKLPWWKRFGKRS